MSSPARIGSLPSPMEITESKAAIIVMEEELKHKLGLLPSTRLRVAYLKKEIKELRGWIAPIRRIPFDILSYIFELCGEHDSKTPVLIGVVCREWRDAVLATPGAWTYLDFAVCNDEKMLPLFIKRSGQRPLHVLNPHTEWIATLWGVVGRVICLSTQILPTDTPFPNLRWLLIHTHRTRIHARPASINAAHFPALTYLAPHAPFDSVLPPGYPPLQNLSLVLSADNGWLAFLIGCQSTLLSLRLDLRDRPSSFMRHRISLPQLRSLEIITANAYANTWTLDLDTPELENYVINSAIDVPLHTDTQRVKVMCVYQFAPTMYSLPALKKLQIPTSEPGEFLYQVFDRHIQFPELVLIEVPPEFAMDEISRQLTAVNMERVQQIRVVTVPFWSREHANLVASSMYSSRLICDHQ